jgi:beta-phosphoglucomutase family hydrolase
MDMAVIFDMDGVMVDNGEFHYKAWKIFCEKHLLPFAEDTFRNKYFGRTNKQILSGLYGKDLSENELRLLADEKEQIYREIYAPVIQPVRGLKEFIFKLKNAGIPIGLATSAPGENVAFVLNALNITQFIDVIVDDSMVTNGKPHPEIYLKTAEILNADPSDCVVFEDSLSGTKSAFDAGMKVFALTTTISREKHKFAHKIVDSFEEIQVEDIIN